MKSDIIHIDMDAFFVSVEVRDDPSLIGKPVAVGGNSNRSVVSTSSYEARKYGIHSGMSMVMAKKRCPGLIIVSINFEKYHQASAAMYNILCKYTDLVEMAGIDEAYLDLSGSHLLYGSTVDIAGAIKSQGIIFVP